MPIRYDKPAPFTLWAYNIFLATDASAPWWGGEADSLEHLMDPDTVNFQYNFCLRKWEAQRKRGYGKRSPCITVKQGRDRRHKQARTMASVLRSNGFTAWVQPSYAKRTPSEYHYSHFPPFVVGCKMELLISTPNNSRPENNHDYFTYKRERGSFNYVSE